MPPPRPGRRRQGAVECPPRDRRRPRCAAAQSSLRGWGSPRPGAAARPPPRARRAADQVPTCARHPRHRGRDARSPATLVSEARDVPEPPREPHGTLHRHWHRQGREGLGLQGRSEEHTSELQSQSNLVCRLLLEKKKKTTKYKTYPLDYTPGHIQSTHRVSKLRKSRACSDT